MTVTTEHVLSPKAMSYLAAVGNGLGVAHVGWTSSVKPAAAHKAHSLSKTVTATVMTGAVYSGLAVNDGIETGDLPWGQWSAFPHVITHKNAEYARLYVVDGTVKATYSVDGVMVNKATFDSYLTPSARESKRPNGGTITVKMESLSIL